MGQSLQSFLFYLSVESLEPLYRFIKSTFFGELQPFIAERALAKSEDDPGSLPLKLQSSLQALQMEDMPAFAPHTGSLP